MELKKKSIADAQKSCHSEGAFLIESNPFDVNELKQFRARIKLQFAEEFQERKFTKLSLSFIYCSWYITRQTP